MKLTICNGSPRGRNSNTSIIAGAFGDGFVSVSGNEIEELFLAKISKHDQYVQRFAQADAVLFAFPLYFNSMPGVVKAFIEKLEPFTGRSMPSPAMVGIVHNGYPVSASCRYVERYVEKFGQRLNSDYRGTIIVPGSEGLRIKPRWMTRKLKKRLFRLGEEFAHNRNLDAGLLKQLAQPEYPGPAIKFMFRALPKNIVNFYWIYQMKKNGVLDRHDDRPFADDK